MVDQYLADPLACTLHSAFTVNGKISLQNQCITEKYHGQYFTVYLDHIKKTKPIYNDTNRLLTKVKHQYIT